MGAARKEPTAENLHDVRKRVKDLWHASQIVRPAAPKQMQRLSKRAHHLADLLGDNHDLAVLGDYVETHPQAFESEAARQALLAVVERRRNALEREALKLGKRLYSQPPKRFVGAVERGWRKRATNEPQELSRADAPAPRSQPRTAVVLRSRLAQPLAAVRSQRCGHMAPVAARIVPGQGDRDGGASGVCPGRQQAHDPRRRGRVVLAHVAVTVA